MFNYRFMVFKNIKVHFLLFIYCLFVTSKTLGWGFSGHKQITRCAIFTLPYPLFFLYKKHIGYITEHSVDPDSRRYVVKDEATNHFIDLDFYDESVINSQEYIPWDKITSEYGEEMVKMHGTVPWSIMRVKKQLTKAFKNKDLIKIVKYSIDLSHYIADSNVPLHTTKNYNGQLTHQEGIHGFWETRLPDLFKKDYDYFIGTAKYIANPAQEIWNSIMKTHKLVNIVLKTEQKLSEKYLSKYSYEKKGQNLIKVYSYEYSKDYHDALAGQVETQMLNAIKLLGSFWYTCWIDAGKPNIEEIREKQIQEYHYDDTEKDDHSSCGLD